MHGPAQAAEGRGADALSGGRWDGRESGYGDLCGNKRIWVSSPGRRNAALGASASGAAITVSYRPFLSENHFDGGGGGGCLPGALTQYSIYLNFRAEQEPNGYCNGLVVTEPSNAVVLLYVLFVFRCEQSHGHEIKPKQQQQQM